LRGKNGRKRENKAWLPPLKGLLTIQGCKGIVRKAEAIKGNKWPKLLGSNAAKISLFLNSPYLAANFSPVS